MNTKILVSILVVILFAACKKDKYNTTPTLTLRNLGNKVVPIDGGILRVEFTVTDKEGDISDTIYLKKTRKNIRTTATIRDSLAFKIPDATDTRNGILEINLEHGVHLLSAINPGNPRQNDTLTLQFTVRDRAKNRSEPVIIDNVVVIR